MAGFFGDWTHTIMPGLHETDDRTFVRGFQAFDQAIMNSPLFMIVFMGALVFTGVAAVLYLRAADHAPLPWVALAFGLYLATVVITMVVHLPLNGVLTAAGDPDRIADLAAVRAAFQETRWVAWNAVRAVATTAAFGCLAWALVLHGRATTDHQAPARQRRHPAHLQERLPQTSPPAVLGDTLPRFGCRWDRARTTSSSPAARRGRSGRAGNDTEARSR